MTSTDDELLKQRNDAIHNLIKNTLMSVLAGLYESGVVKRVNMGKLVQLFGLDDSNLDKVWINFDDPEFLVGYNAYKIKQAHDNNVTKQRAKVDKKVEDFNDNTNRTLH